MSAYIVDREHIAYLIDAALSRRIMRGASEFRWYVGSVGYSLRFDNATAVGQMLWDENISSIQARYPDTRADMSNAPGPIGETFEYEHRLNAFAPAPDPVQVLKSVACYEYQSCEHGGWAASSAYTFCDALRHAAITALPGYDAAEWGAPEQRGIPA
mgnify:CR=1 FL=1